MRVLVILILLAILAAPARASSLVAYWKFDDATGTTPDDSAGAHEGTFSGSPTWTAGKYGGGLDTQNGHVVVPHASDLSDLTTLTFAMWFYAESWASFPVLLNKDGGNGYYLQYAGGYLGTWINNLPRGGVGSPSLNAWHHVAWVYDGASFTPYFDGVAQTAAAHTGTIAPSGSSVLTIGDYFSGYAFDGIVDDVAIWRSALSAAEITAVMGGTILASAVPEPGSAAALAAIAVGLAIRRVRDRRRVSGGSLCLPHDRVV